MSAVAKSLARSDARFALTIVAGLVLVNTIIFILPLLYAAWISFHDRDVILHTQAFIGFGNYRRILASSEAIAAILLSLKFTVLVAVASLLIGLGIALVLNEEFPGRRLLRAAVLLPWAISEVATATAWMFIVNPTFGALTGVLHPLGLVEANHAWINANTALYWVALAFVWHITPLCAFLFLAALQTAPESLYQAARIDRAPAFQRFLHITLPHLRPTVMLVLVVVTVEAFRSFDLLFAMTRGGPGTASQTFPMLIFRYTFEFSRYGLGAAASYILVAIGMAITTVYYFVLTRRRRLVKIDGAAAQPSGTRLATAEKTAPS
ncbi:MAG TPA: sugar ABC transporter permease [Roseiarcus sp.]|jgi:ABC-type sugar transport system permease subunit